MLDLKPCFYILDECLPSQLPGSDVFPPRTAGIDYLAVGEPALAG
jgi:hypothetical protein